jgi:hypothetical protein
VLAPGNLTLPEGAPPPEAEVVGPVTVANAGQEVATQDVTLDLAGSYTHTCHTVCIEGLSRLYYFGLSLLSAPSWSTFSDTDWMALPRVYCIGGGDSRCERRHRADYRSGTCRYQNLPVVLSILVYCCCLSSDCLSSLYTRSVGLPLSTDPGATDPGEAVSSDRTGKAVCVAALSLLSLKFLWSPAVFECH